MNVPRHVAPVGLLLLAPLLLAAGCAGPAPGRALEDAEALVREDSDDAPEALARAAEEAPEAADPWRRIATCWFERARARAEDHEERAQALANAGAALAVASRNATPAEHVLLQRDLAALAMVTGDSYGAITHLRRYCSHRPEDIQAAVALARLLLERGRSTEARDALEPLRGRLDGDGTAVLGAAYYLLDDLGDAESALRRALALAVTEDLRARYAYDLGLVLLAQGRDEEAEESFELALDLDDDHEGARRELDRARVRGWLEPEPRGGPGTAAHRAPRPETWVPPGMEVAPPTAPADVAPLTSFVVPTVVTPEDLLREGREHLGHGDRAAALVAFSRAIELAPTFAAAYLERGEVRHALGELDQAIADCTSAITLAPRLAPAYHTRGQTLHAQGKPDAALADFTAALELRPTYAEAYDSRGLVQAELEFVDSALEDFGKALELDPALRSAWVHRAAARAGQGDHKGAKNDLDQALALQPDDGEALRERGAARHALGDHKGAAEDLRLALDLLPEDHPGRDATLQRMEACLAEAAPPGNSGPGEPEDGPPPDPR